VTVVENSIGRRQARRRPRSLATEVWRKRRIYAFLVPTFVLLLIFGYWPPISAFYHAFFDWNGSTRLTYVGLDNFVQMLDDRALKESIKNIAVLEGTRLLINLTIPLGVAKLIFGLRHEKVSYFWRLMIVVPLVVPTIVVYLLWQAILDPNIGLLNALLGGAGLDGLKGNWLGDPRTALFAFILVGFPWVNGTTVLIYLAGLNNIGDSVLDACRIDGAGGWRRFWSIEVPLIMSQIKLIVGLNIIYGLQGFGGQLVLTNGGPGYATLVPGLHMFQEAFIRVRFGYAAALGLAMFLVIFALTYANSRLIRSSVEFEAD
jgi:ABC-type sugar transport system permease subunit